MTHFTSRAHATEMKLTKNHRQALILALIREHKIGTQEDLVSRILQTGAYVTQATISRDIRELNLIKMTDESGQVYYGSMKRDDEQPDLALWRVFTEATLSVSAAENLVVVKTMSGLAPGAASMLDGLKHDLVVGSIAGDDTIFLACKNKEDALALSEQLYMMLQRKWS